MPKTHYTATDPNGAVHKRSTDRRVYTHTVVFLPSYEADMANATHKDWAKTDASNFNYYTRSAAGLNAPRNYRAEHPDKWTAEEIAESQAWSDEENAKRIARGREETSGHTLESYIAAKRAERVQFIEDRKAAGYYRTYQNAGWCGRLDLAQKLATKHGPSAVILEAKEVGR